MKIEDAIQSKFKSPQMKAMINIRYTSNFFASKHNAFMAEFGLSMAQFNILRILRGAKETISVNTVKQRMIEKSPNTTRLMDKLIEKEFITRVRCEEDRRVVYVRISESGLDLLARIDIALADDDMTTCNLSDKEADILSDLLDKVRKG